MTWRKKLKINKSKFVFLKEVVKEEAETRVRLLLVLQ